MNRRNRLAAAVLAAAASLALTACSTPEAKVESFTKRGQALLASGDLVKARLEFQNALQINPSSASALFGLARVAERSKDWPAAYQLLQKVIEVQPAHVDALVQLGQIQLAAGQVDKAKETAQGANAIRPASPDVLALRAAVALKSNEPAQAVALAGQALAASPRHVDALVVLAAERMQAGDADGTVAFLDKGLEADERNMSLQMFKVQALEKFARSDRAEQVLRRVVELFPKNLDYRYLLASFYAGHKRLDDAEREYRAIVAGAPDKAEPKLQLVRFLQETRGIDAAANQLEKFSQAEPDAYDLGLALAAMRLSQKKDTEAVALWKAVIDKAGDDAAGVRARGAYASYQLAHDDKASAQALVAEMLHKDERNEQALFLRAGIAMDEHRLDDAIGDLRTILRDSPENPGAHLMLARAHDKQGAGELAAQHYAQAAQASHFAPAFTMPYAQQLLRSGRTRQAEALLREVLRANPAHVPALRMLTATYLKTGDLDGAQAVADEAAKAHAGEAVASELKGSVQLARRDYGSGIAQFKRAFELSPTDPQPLAGIVRTYRTAGRTDEAIQFLDAVPASDSRYQLARVMEGELLAQNGKLAAGLQKLQEGIAVRPGEAFAHQTLIRVQLAAGKPQEALASADRALKQVPNDFGLRLTRAGLLDRQGRFDEAIAAYEALLAERPDELVVANNLATLLGDHRKDAASIKRACEIAQKLRGSDLPQVKDTVGWTLHLAGKDAEAASFLKSAALQAPGLAIVQYHYAMNQLALNNVQNARQALRRAVDLAASSPFAQADDARKALQKL
jgi:tetratricopeptide (TPR) repeat protein